MSKQENGRILKQINYQFVIAHSIESNGYEL